MIEFEPLFEHEENEEFMHIYFKFYSQPEKLAPLKEFILNDTFGGRYCDVSKTNWHDEARDEENDFIFVKLFYDCYWGHYAHYVRHRFPNTALHLTNVWYQVYEPGDQHDWHDHPDEDLANVLYLEVPDKSVPTEFWLPWDEENPLVPPDVDVGDTLVFPAQQYHRSPVNDTNQRKIVIAFNCKLVSLDS